MFFKHLLALWLAILLIAGATGFAVYNGQNNRKHQNQGVHIFLCYFEDAVLKTPQTPEKRRRAIRFFNGINEKILQPVCALPKESNVRHSK